MLETENLHIHYQQVVSYSAAPVVCIMHRQVPIARSVGVHPVFSAARDMRDIARSSPVTLLAFCKRGSKELVPSYQRPMAPAAVDSWALDYAT